MTSFTPEPVSALVQQLRRWVSGLRVRSTPGAPALPRSVVSDSRDRHDPVFGCRIHVYRQVPGTPVGHPSGTRTFMLVHGLGMSYRYFDVLRPVLQAHGDVFVPDLPGFGGLPTPERTMNIEDGAAALGEALDAYGITNCVLVGQSMGAQFVTDLAGQRPDIISHVVLIGPVTDTAHNSALRQTRVLLADALLEKSSTNRLVARSYAQCGIPWFRAELAVMLTYPLEERLAAIPHPTLILRGSWDPIANHTWCQKLASRMRRGQLISIKAQPHAADRNAAPQITRAILGFLARTEPPNEI